MPLDISLSRRRFRRERTYLVAIIPSLVVFTLLNNRFLGFLKGKTPFFAQNLATKCMPRQTTRRLAFEIPRVPTCIAGQIISLSERGYKVPDALKSHVERGKLFQKFRVLEQPISLSFAFVKDNSLTSFSCFQQRAFG